MATAAAKKVGVRPSVNGESIQAKFADARKALSQALIERDEEIDLVLTGLIAKEHPLLVGAPGTAKSLLLTSLGSLLKVPTFNYLLTKFTDPGELFGPIDVLALTKSGKTQRIVDGYLPTASLVFLDETFKGSSAILNTLLTFLNERKYKAGLQEVKCPLLMAVGASNEWPDGEELGALLDRFLLRKKVKTVTSARGTAELLQRAITNDPCLPKFKSNISVEELQEANRQATALPVSKEGLQALTEIVHELKKEGIVPTNRRLVKSVSAARAYAFLNEAKEVSPEHLEMLAHVLWDDPQEQPEKAAKIIAKIANPIGMKVNGLLAQLEDVVAKSRPAEAVPKIQDLVKELQTMKQDARVVKALAYTQQQLKATYNKVIHADFDAVQGVQRIWDYPY